MSLISRLATLERRGGDGDWCRCPFDSARWQAEMQRAMAAQGGLTPAMCDRCGRARRQVQFFTLRHDGGEVDR